jgi:uncharacterized phage protein gp47/JayE
VSKTSYGFTPNGYVVKPLATVLEESFARLHAMDPRISTTKGSWIWEVYKSKALEYNELDKSIGTLADIINLDNAADWALQSWGNSRGVFLKNATNATLILKCTGPATGYLVPTGSTFSTRTGIAYDTTADATIPSIIRIRKGAPSGTDDIPWPYSDVTSIAWINTSANQSGTSYAESTDWTYAGDQITWLGASEPAENTYYYIGLEATEDVSVKVSSVAAEAGAGSRVSIGQITENTDGLGGVTSVTNEYNSIGGADIESNAAYRLRIKSLVNTQFGYQKIAQLVGQLEAIRATKCFQTVGVDVAFPSAAWDVAGTWTSFETIAMYGDDDVVYGQTFVPTGDRLTIKYITLYARKVGSPCPLRLKLYLWNTDYATTVANTPISNRIFTIEDVDPDHPTDWQEIQVPCRFGSQDPTHTYLFTIENDDDTSDAGDHWEFKYQETGDEYADGEMFVDESADADADIAFKTNWGGASYNLVVAANLGYDLYDYVSQIESMIIDFNRKAYSPICIQGNIMEATTAYINVTGTVFIDPSQDWDNVVAEINENMAAYINGLGPGDNVVFSQVEYVIMHTTGVIKLLDCTIERNDDGAITKATEADVLVGQLEIALLDTGTYGPGTDFTEGSM